MITILCGEDTATSRNFFVQLKRQYTQKGYEIKDITPAQLYELPKWLGESVSLFGTKQVFFVERLESIIQRRRGRKSSKPADPNSLDSIIAKIAADRGIEMIDWEEKSGREIKLKDNALVKEFKPSKNIFGLLDCFLPGKKSEFIIQLRELCQAEDENFIFVMLYRHIKALILATDSSFSKTVQPWQRTRLKNQAILFGKKQLVAMYEALYRLELGNKTGTNPQGLRKGLEILACYYL